MVEYTTREKEWIWLSSIDSVNPVTFNRIINYYQSVGVAISSLHNDLNKLSFLSDGQKSKIRQGLSEKYIERVLALLEKHNIKAVAMFNDDYPENLKHIYDPPPVLYCIGDTKLLNSKRLLGVIGSRKPTEYGLTCGKNITAELADNNVCIVSGMAMGIDASAHIGALSVGGDTIAVLGCGPEICYPPCNKPLYNDIKKHGVIVSEYLPTTHPDRFRFPARNRIISGISQGILVVEAAKTSGTLITITCAQDQGKDVLAIPGNISSGESYTPNHLIQEGCAIVLEYKDIMEWFGWRQTAGDKDRGIHMQQMDMQEQSVYNIISDKGNRFDEIQFLLDYSPIQLISLLSRLELKGIIRKLPGNRYEKA